MALSTDDRLDIHELLARYNTHRERGTDDDFAMLFLPNGAHIGTSGAPLWRSREELLERVAQPQPEGWEGAQHWVNNVIITEVGDGGDRASVFANVMLISKKGEAIFLGTYHDDVVKIEERWFFELVKSDGVYPAGSPWT